MRTGYRQHLWDASTGKVHSLESQDDDYNFNLLPLLSPINVAWTTATDSAAGLHLEFSSDDTIDHFHTPWWSKFHAAVDDDDSRSLDNPFGEPTGEVVIFGFSAKSDTAIKPPTNSSIDKTTDKRTSHLLLVGVIMQIARQRLRVKTISVSQIHTNRTIPMNGEPVAPAQT